MATYSSLNVNNKSRIIQSVIAVFRGFNDCETNAAQILNQLQTNAKEHQP